LGFRNRGRFRRGAHPWRATQTPGRSPPHHYPSPVPPPARGNRFRLSQSTKRALLPSQPINHAMTRLSRSINPSPVSANPSMKHAAPHRCASSGHRQQHQALLHRNVQRFRGGLVFKAHRFLYHSTLGLRVMKKKIKRVAPADSPNLANARRRAATCHSTAGTPYSRAPATLDAQPLAHVGVKQKWVGHERYLRLIQSCITQLQAQGPSRTCNESKEDETRGGGRPWGRAASHRSIDSHLDPGPPRRQSARIPGSPTTTGVPRS